MERVLLKQRGMPAIYWAEAVSTAVSLLNRSSTWALSDKMAYEAWHGSRPTVQFLCTFGCLAYVKELGHRSKLEDRSTPGVFIGYEEGVKAYRVLDSVTQRVRTTRDVVFDEDRGWSWLQEEDGNTRCNSDFVIKYLVEAAVAVEESATPSSTSLTSPGMSSSTTSSISSTSRVRRPFRLLPRLSLLPLVRLRVIMRPLQVLWRVLRVLVRPLQVLVRPPRVLIHLRALLRAPAE
jgi:hypothetical protein